jgi:hypothetical protein
VVKIFLLNLWEDDDSWGGDFFIPLLFGKDSLPPELEVTATLTVSCDCEWSDYQYWVGFSFVFSTYNVLKH